MLRVNIGPMQTYVTTKPQNFFSALENFALRSQVLSWLSLRRNKLGRKVFMSSLKKANNTTSPDLKIGKDKFFWAILNQLPKNKLSNFLIDFSRSIYTDQLAQGRHLKPCNLKTEIGLICFLNSNLTFQLSKLILFRVKHIRLLLNLDIWAEKLRRAKVVFAWLCFG